MYVVPISEEAELVLLPVSAAEALTALVERNRDRLSEWEDWATRPFSVERSREWLRERIDDFVSGKRIGTYLRVDEELAGSIGLGIRGHVGEVGYWLDSAYEGRGLASAGVRALLDVGFGQRALERIELRTSVRNFRSRALATGVGFVHEGTLRHAIARPGRDGVAVFEDEAIYALLAAEWTRAQRLEAAGQ
jgi:ribosomal-protein-serine acetyltransferase